MRPRTVVALYWVAVVGCATTHAVRPLGRGNDAATASLGGPLVQVANVDIATPILVVAGAHGLRDDLEVTGEADLTAAVYGDLHLAPGLAYHPVVRDGGAVPTLTVAGAVHLLTNFAHARVGPQLTVAAAWRIARRHLVYGGVDSAVVFGSPSRLVVGPLLGAEWRTGRFGVALEAKWLAPYYDVGPAAPSWISPDSQGYLSVLVGVTRYFGEVR